MRNMLDLAGPADSPGRLTARVGAFGLRPLSTAGEKWGPEYPMGGHGGSWRRITRCDGSIPRQLNLKERLEIVWLISRLARCVLPLPGTAPPPATGWCG